MTQNRVIGLNNTIPWHIPGEQTRFKKITMGHALIMGRKTWQSLAHPLPGRRNIVLTRHSSFQAPGAEVACSLEEAFGLCRQEQKIFVIGGEQLYAVTLPFADTLIITIVPLSVAGDAFFLEFNLDAFTAPVVEQIHGPTAYTILTYRRQS